MTPSLPPITRGRYRFDNKRVVDLRKEPYDVYIGRWNGRYHLPQSKWNNPFKEGVDGTREEVIQKFRDYLLNNPILMAQLPELKGKTLGCWCKPKACHGDVIVEFLDNQAGSRKPEEEKEQKRP